MENLAGYARIVAAVMIDRQLNKRLLGRPYLKYGQCPALWGYVFQLGSILAGKHGTQLDAFGSAFLGLHTDPGEIKQISIDIAHQLVEGRQVNGSMTFFDYVQRQYLQGWGYAGAASSFFYEHGMDKLRPQSVADAAYHFASQGAALGAIHPRLVKEMFALTHQLHSKEGWTQAFIAGLDIGPEQVVKSYQETEDEEDAAFLTYCKECQPHLYSLLSN